MQQQRATTAEPLGLAAVVSGLLVALLSPELVTLLAEAPSALTLALVVAAAALARHGVGLVVLPSRPGHPVATSTSAPAYLAERIADPQVSPRRPRAPGTA